MHTVTRLAALAGVAYTFYYFYPELRRYMRLRAM